jgi:IS5 family transposase
MIEARRTQTTFADGLIAEEVSDLWEPWMRHSDAVLEDVELVEIVCQALSKRCKKSKTRGRKGTPADVVLRLLALKHMFNWSYDEMHREVRANLVYREFTRLGGGKVPDDKTMGRLARQLGPEPVEKLHQRLVAIAQAKKIVEGRKLRVDTTVVETNIHYPTDSSLMGDGVRVLTRLMKRISEITGAVGTKLRDRTRSVKLRVVEIARASRSKSEQGRERMKGLYEKLLTATAAVVGQAQRFAQGYRHRSEAFFRRNEASRCGRDEERTRDDGATSETGDEANTGASAARRHARGGETGQRVRTDDGGHPPGQSQTTDRIRQDDQGAGSRKTDHHQL